MTHALQSLCVFSCLGEGAVKTGVGGKIGGGKQQGSQPEVYTDASTPRPCSSSSFLLLPACLPACQTSIQLRGCIQREAHNLICVLCWSCAQSTTIYLFIPILKIKREMKTHLFHYFFLHSSAFQLTKIHIYANMQHLLPPQPRMGDGSQARINDIASSVMFAAFH